MFLIILKMTIKSGNTGRESQDSRIMTDETLVESMRTDVVWEGNSNGKVQRYKKKRQRLF